MIELLEEPAVGAPPEPDASVEIDVRYADDDVIVVAKPAGLVVHPGAGHADGTLVNGLLARFPDLAAIGDPYRPGIVHRLDRDTSGLLVVRPVAGRLRQPRRADLDAHRSTAGTSRSCGARSRRRAASIDAPIGRSTAAARAWRCGSRARSRVRSTRCGRRSSNRCAASSTAGSRPGAPIRSGCTSSAIGHPVVGDATYGGSRGLDPPRAPVPPRDPPRVRPPGHRRTPRLRRPLPPELEAVLTLLA